MAIRKSSISGTPFGNTANRPSNAQVGQTYYNGELGYLEIYTNADWIPATGANDFSLNLGGTHTSINLTQSYSSGSYSITSASNDTTMDIYAYAADGSLAGYTNTKSLTASQRFTKVVVLGGSSGEVLSFSYKTTYPTNTSTSDVTAGPYITSISPSSMPNQNDTISITGGNFASNVAVHFTGSGYSSTAAKNITRSSSTSLIVTRPDNFPISGSPYTVIVTNPSVANQPTGSNSHIYSGGITAGNFPSWQTSNSIAFYTNVNSSIQLSATDADGGSSIAYSYVSGSLPTGLSFDSSTGVISGTPTTAQSTSYVVRATDSGGNTADRTFSITISNPSVSGGSLTSDSTYYYRTFTGNGTLTIDGQISADVLIVAGGGGGGDRHGGGGGAGGYRSLTSETFNSASYTVTVGAGGNGGRYETPVTWQGTTYVGAGLPGENSSIIGGSKSLISVGGGGGGTMDGNPPGGGSGGGGGGFNLPGIAPSVSGQGNAGGSGQQPGGGGGGGAGAAGGNSTGNNGGNGGSGLQWLNGNYYAGGGGGAANASNGSGGSGGQGGGGNGAWDNGHAAGSTNTGGGGGATRSENTSTVGQPGGSGIVIVRYTKASVGG